ncbi:MAG: hypothetical protein ACXV5I_00680 [Halobacteriota archaeon]
MALNRVLKLDITLLIISLGIIIASSFLIFSGNSRFIGILGIAILASALIVWRIFVLVRQNHASMQPEGGSQDFDLGDLQRKRPPRT